MKYKYNGQWNEMRVKASDTLPIGTEVYYDGDTVPTGYIEVQDYSYGEINTEKKWVNGKPIYRKNFISQEISHGSEFSFESLGLNNVDEIISINGFGKLGNSQWRLDYKMNTSGSFIAAYIDTDNKKLCFECNFNGTPVSIVNANTIIEYTKTTD